MILVFFPREKAPILVFIWCFIYLSAINIERMYYRYLVYETDFSAPQMILTIKLTSLGWNYRDGAYPDEKLDNAWKKTKIEKLPSLMEMASFVFFFAGVLGGPAFEIREYLEFTEMKDWYPNNKQKPNSYIAGLIRMLHAFASLSVMIAISKVFPLKKCYTDEFQQYNYALIWIHLFFATIQWRCQYYFAWILTEGANIFAGFGFNGYDAEGKPKWDRLINVRVLDIEKSQNPRGISSYWNMTAAKWLRNHVYLRCLDENGQVSNKAMYVTMFVSAFWHGFYPGYYYHFFMCAIGIHCGRLLRRYIRPFIVKNSDNKKVKEEPIYPWKHIYDFLGWFLTQFLLANSCVTFNGLSWENTMRTLVATRFVGIAALILTMIFFEAFGPYLRKIKKD